ncbi:hypothetical protein HYW55_01575 [Candidatus Gottesmanbacteria bacterium]|nr:hypothetical protein [Candidatus Gottesmanbacteria bacterium]
MILLIAVIVIFVVSFFLAYKAMKKELGTPPEVENLKISRKKNIGGVILFLKKKIIHYSSDTS